MSRSGRRRHADRPDDDAGSSVRCDREDGADNPPPRLHGGTERELLTRTEVGVLGAAANTAGRTLIGRQASRAVDALAKLQSEGYSGELTSGA